MPAGSTYTPIATTTLGSAAASYTFSSIPSTYTDLVLIASVKTVSGDDGISLRYNSDSGSNYSWIYLLGNGSAAASGRNANDSKVQVGNVNATDFSPSIVNIQNYANTTTFKTSVSRTSLAGNYVIAYTGLWRNTAAINSIQILHNSGSNFLIGSTFTLYGIAAA